MDSGNFRGENIFTHVYNKDEVIIPPENARKKTIINIVLTLIVAALGYYFMLPALNFKDIKLYFYIGLVVMAYPVFSFFTSKALMRPEYLPYVKKKTLIPGAIICVLVLCVVVTNNFMRHQVTGITMDMTATSQSQHLKKVRSIC